MDNACPDHVAHSKSGPRIWTAPTISKKDIHSTQFCLCTYYEVNLGWNFLIYRMELIPALFLYPPKSLKFKWDGICVKSQKPNIRKLIIDFCLPKSIRITVINQLFNQSKRSKQTNKTLQLLLKYLSVNTRIKHDLVWRSIPDSPRHVIPPSDKTYLSLLVLPLHLVATSLLHITQGIIVICLSVTPSDCELTEVCSYACNPTLT